MKNNEKILLIAVGNALYGERWQTDLARDLGLSDGRRIRQWLSGDRPIPAGIWIDLNDILESRNALISEALNDIKTLTLLMP